jgi:hypothetical protein
MVSMTLEAVREAIDACGETDRAAFARRTRNALAAAILAESLAHDVPAAPDHEPPVAELHSRVGDDLGDALAAIYEGRGDWTSRAIDALEPLHELARR